MKKNKIVFLNTQTEKTSIKESWVINIWYIICDLSLNEIKRENLFLKINEKEEKNKNLILKDFENAYIVSHNFWFDRNTLKNNDIKIWNNTEWIDNKIIAYNLYKISDLKTLKINLDYHVGQYDDEDVPLYNVMLLKSVFWYILSEFETQAHNNWADLYIVEMLDLMVEDTEKKYDRDNLIY